VTQALYPPGSTFKVVTMAAALASGLFTRDTKYNCTSTWDELGSGFIKYDWTLEKGLPPWGEIDLVESLIVSCNPYNYHIGLTVYNVEPDLLPDMASAFGLGQPTGIVGLPPNTNEEVGGLVPDSDWNQATTGQGWSAGDSVNMAIGQGDLQVTPLQMANLYAAIANGGTLYRPQLVLSIAAPGEPPIYEFKPEIISQLPLTLEQLEVIREGLRGVVADRRGTARQRFFGLQIPIYGKTGTAEDPGGGAPHAWFVGYTQANSEDKPDIAIAVVLQNRGEGSEWAAPIFRRIVEDYFFGRPETLYPWEAEIGLTATPTPLPMTDTPPP
jgi:penicillin-binding protein 2